MTSDEIKKLIRDIPDFPKPGILFRDITPLIGEARGLAAIVDQVAEPWLGKVDMVLGIESRGFIFGAPVAYRLGAALEMHQDSLTGKSRVLVVDDLLATGGTALAAIRLAHKVGSEVVGCAFVIELNALKGRERLAPVPCLSLVQYD